MSRAIPKSAILPVIVCPEDVPSLSRVCYLPVIVCPVDVPGHSKVCYFNYTTRSFGGEEAVPEIKYR
jgi:hypothetical protein